MARKHKTARTKQQMADEALREQEARQAEEARQKRLREARTRSEKSRPLAQAKAKREHAPANEEVEKCRSAERKLDVTQDNQEKGEEGQNEGDSSVCQDRVDDVSISAEAEEKEPVESRQARQGKKRFASDVEKYELVYAPAIVPAEHASWAVFDSNLKEYMRRARQVLVVGETFNVGRRNAALRSQTQYAGFTDTEIPLVPEEYEVYQRKYICTHK
ncbi:hypothetical protein PC129_g19228 [Phytophthora cactorum]|uniref:Uncharacterized protein n=1 Tax=Phytophthora cactorum TaxID=29920 RepID=A0A329SYI0_9STRA|nr:hypothetical protein Pcac1_g6546 [Phytophthora cactorum]KAG2801249.1 hypothetical protein PC111_g19620 [Phytophthora cactorum]KAG2811246.1 hypothetical protein PC112_g15693 [Phytophthora cactorum]KAG2835448.1 hypothetical protein PC113_g20212 [Phytophthora cactorum]KAG2889246.1 hypothetical protein PC115_g19800 [Phytophthora cactorum]